MAAAMIEIRRMWEGGPGRQFSATRFGSATPYESPVLKGFAGNYVCDECQQGCKGVYQVKASDSTILWLCSPCRKTVRPRRPQPEGLARAQKTSEAELAR